MFKLSSWALLVKFFSSQCHKILFYGESTLAQVMAWCHQASSHYLSRCWPRFMSAYSVTRPNWFNTLRPRQNERHFADDILKCIFLNENVWIPIEISLKFVPKGPIDNIPALVKIMAWRRQGDKPLSEPMRIRLPTHICVTRPQWVKDLNDDEEFPTQMNTLYFSIFYHLSLKIPLTYLDTLI